VRAAALPTSDRAGIEPRGALWVSVTAEEREIQILNTHLGLLGSERVRQVEALLGDDWLRHPDCRSPAILCGDFNAMPRSRAYRLLEGELRDAQIGLNGHRARSTFYGRFPFGRIDHVFLRGPLQVVSVQVVRSPLARTASDHLPLVVDLRWKE
jgi:endonuclease/exonuclease/phosphatase family metal-dependent hydrolase